jgi:hypothetical protein
MGATLHFRQHNPAILRGNRPFTEMLQSTSRIFSLTQAKFQLNWRGGLRFSARQEGAFDRRRRISQR